MSTQTTRGVRPSICNDGRYTAIEVDGHRRRFRDQATLRIDVIALLDRDGALAKKRIIMALHTAQAAIDIALSELEEAGKVERFRAKSARGRSDEYWCINGSAPNQSGPKTHARYRAYEILDAFRRAAAWQYRTDGVA